MPKSKVSVIPINTREELVDAKTMGAQLGFTGEYVNRMAAAGKIPWRGIRNGAKVYRRYNPADVMAALAHDVEEPVVPPMPVQPARKETRRERA
jgi:hypothetical protein